MENRYNIPKNWRWLILGDVSEAPQYGWTTRASSSGSIHLLRTTDITSGKINWNKVPYCEKLPENIEKYLLYDGDIVISRAGSVGYSYLIKNPNKAIFASYLIRFKPKINEKYFLYFLKSPSYWKAISEKKLGIAIPNVNATKLKSINIPIPPETEQEKIVSKIEELFSQLDAGVAGLKRAQAELQRYRASVLKAAFEGRLVPQDPNDTPAQILLSSIGKDPLIKEGLKTLPTNWVWTTINDIGNVKGGKRLPKGHDYSEVKSKFPYIRVVDFINNSVDISNLEYLTASTREEIKKYTISKSDVYISIAGSIGKVGVIPEILDGANLTENAAKITSLKIIHNKYLALFLDSPFAKKQIKLFTISSNQPKLALFRIKKIILPLPPKEEQIRIVNEVEKILTLLHSLEMILQGSINRSYKLRQTILKSAFEGKLIN